MLEAALATGISASVAGALLSIDRTAVLQAMVSRPIVAGPIIGLVLGDVESALLVGAVLELLFIGDPPVGSHLPVHETGLTALVTAMTLTAVSSMGALGVYGAALVLPSMIVVALPASFFLQKADSYARGVNERLYENALKGVEAGRNGAVLVENLKGAGVFFICALVSMTVVAVPLVYAVGFVFSRIGAEAFFYPAIAGCAAAGAAAALAAVWKEGGALYLYLGSGAVTAALWAAFL